LASIASESDLTQLILAKLASIKAGNEALNQTLARQEARHHDEIVALRREFEELLATTQQSASLLRVATEEAKVRPATETTATSGDGLSPSQLTLPATRSNSERGPTKSERLPNPPAFNSKRKDLLAFL
jgi:hypothetical protein